MLDAVSVVVLLPSWPTNIVCIMSFIIISVCLCDRMRKRECRKENKKMVRTVGLEPTRSNKPLQLECNPLTARANSLSDRRLCATVFIWTQSSVESVERPVLCLGVS